jgi:hypothetical protein
LQQGPSARNHDYKPIARCCESHPDWPTLAQHICDAFPTLSVADIARELRIARDAMDACDVGDDALVIAEVIARHRLMLAAGEITDAAKLDPQTHTSRI